MIICDKQFLLYYCQKFVLLLDLFSYGDTAAQLNLFYLQTKPNQKTQNCTFLFYSEHVFTGYIGKFPSLVLYISLIALVQNKRNYHVSLVKFDKIYFFWLNCSSKGNIHSLAALLVFLYLHPFHLSISIKGATRDHS